MTAQGALYRGARRHRRPPKTEYAELTNPRDLRCSANEALDGADVYIGLSTPGAVSADAIRRMADRAIVFAMANPVPEVMPEEIEGDVEVIATGRSDYPNQINNVLAFPGVFRGALDVRAREITSEMEVAAAQAIAAVVKPEELEADYIVPSVFNREVAPAVAAGGRRKRPSAAASRGSRRSSGNRTRQPCPFPDPRSLARSVRPTRIRSFHARRTMAAADDIGARIRDATKEQRRAT